MLSEKVLRTTVVTVAATLILAAAILFIGELSAGLRRADIGFASLWLCAAFALGLWQDRGLLGSGGLVRGIVSAVALVPAAFALLLLAVGGYTAAAAVAVWLSIFAVLNTTMRQSAWTRPIALAGCIAAVLAVCSFRGRVDNFNAGVAEKTTWLSSMLLDASVTPHLRPVSTAAADDVPADSKKAVLAGSSLRHGQAIELISGAVRPAARVALWDGALPMLALASLSIIFWRRSLVQAALVAFAVVGTWIAVQAVGTWLVVPDVDAAAAAAASGRTLTVGSAVATLLCSLTVVIASAATALCVGHLTDPIPVAQPEWNQPVATYFWNFVMRLPGSLSPAQTV